MKALLCSLIAPVIALAAPAKSYVQSGSYTNLNPKGEGTYTTAIDVSDATLASDDQEAHKVKEKMDFTGLKKGKSMTTVFEVHLKKDNTLVILGEKGDRIGCGNCEDLETKKGKGRWCNYEYETVTGKVSGSKFWDKDADTFVRLGKYIDLEYGLGTFHDEPQQ